MNLFLVKHVSDIVTQTDKSVFDMLKPTSFDYTTFTTSDIHHSNGLHNSGN